MLQSKWGRRLSFSYLGIFLLAAAFAAYLLIFDPVHSEFAGLYAFLVALPWSIFFAPILGLGAPFLGAFINVIIIYYIGKFLDKALINESLNIEITAPVSLDNDGSVWKKFNLFFWLNLFLLILSFSSAFLPFAQLTKYISLIIVLSFVAKIGGIFILSYFGFILTQKNEYMFLGLLVLLPGVLSLAGFIVGYIILWKVRKNNSQTNVQDNNIKNDDSKIVFIDKSEENNVKKQKKNYIIWGVIIITVIITGLILFIKSDFNQTNGSYSEESGSYKNKQYGFQLNVPASWKAYSVQEAITCPTIKREYADNYYLIKSPTANYNETGFIINKESLNVDYFVSSPLDQVRAQLKGKDASLYEMALSQNPGILEEQKKWEAEISQYKQLNIKGFKVYRKNYEVTAGMRREDNYFVANGSLLNIYYYAPASGNASVTIEQMREVVDETLARY